MKRAEKRISSRSIPADGLDRDATATLIAAAGDIGLVVDASGVITDVAMSDSAEPPEDSDKWVGMRWIDTVTVESRPKVEAMLRDVSATGSSRRRQVNHPSTVGGDLPVAYTALRLGTQGGLVAVGRDMRAIAALQQRLVETQQTLERDYWRMRHVETRYRLLFQLSSEAILVVDAANRKIVDANESAGRLFERPVEKLVGLTFPVGVDESSQPVLEDALAIARSAGRSDPVEATLSAGGSPLHVSVSCFRQDTGSLFLVRFASSSTATANEPVLGAEVGALMANVPDAFIIADADGRVLTANRAFLDLVQLTGETQAHGRLISEWIGRPGADLGVFLAMMRKHGVVRIMATALRGEQGSNTEVEISAASVELDDRTAVGFIVRDVGRRVANGPQGARDLTRAVEQLTSLVGRVALRDLLRDTTDLVERHFIEAALEITRDNRTAAAEMLGLSRQSLYVKLRRHKFTEGSGPTLDKRVG